MSDAVLDEMSASERFLELVATGVGVINAGYHVDWPPAMTRRKLSDPEFASLVADAQERLVEDVEQALYEKAKRGHVRAAELILFSRHANRGWVPPAQRVHVHGEHTLDVSVIASVKEAAKELARSMPIHELQGAPDDVEGEIVDAEIVDGDADD